MKQSRRLLKGHHQSNISPLLFPPLLLSPCHFNFSLTLPSLHSAACAGPSDAALCGASCGKRSLHSQGLLTLVATVINSSTRQGASPANIYLHTHYIPVWGHTSWWTNLNLHWNPVNTMLKRVNQRGRRFNFTFSSFLSILILQAALSSSERWLQLDKAVCLSVCFTPRKTKGVFVLFLFLLLLFQLWS